MEGAPCGGTTFSAAGGSASPLSTFAVDNTFNDFSLIGYIGTPPPCDYHLQNGLPSGYRVGHFNSDPKCFSVGNTLTNYQLPGSGTLYFMQNFTGSATVNFQLGMGEGKQLVRIILAQ